MRYEIHIDLPDNVDFKEYKKSISFISPDIEQYRYECGELVLQICDAENDEDAIKEKKQKIIDFVNASAKGYITNDNKYRVLAKCDDRTDYTDTDKIINSSYIIGFEPGLIGFNCEAMRLFDYFDRSFRAMAVSSGAVEERYPVLLPVKAYEKTGYLRTSPQAGMFCSCTLEDINELKDLQSMASNGDISCNILEKSRYALSPSACFHTYERYKEQCLSNSKTITFCQSVFRNEGRFSWSDFGRLRDYHIREIVFIGDDKYVNDNRMLMVKKVKSFLDEIHMNYSIEVSNDPFIIPKLQKIRKLQVKQESKYELRLNYSKEDTLAAASFNIHGNAFTQPFHINICGCDNTVTGCIGFGLERWVLAFLCQFGTDSGRWPINIKECLDD